MAQQVGVYGGTFRQSIASVQAGISPIFIPSRYFNPNNNAIVMTNAIVAGVADSLNAYPLIVPTQIVIDRIAIRGGAALALSKVRMGIYDSDPISKAPRSLLTNFAEIDVSGATQVYEVNCDISLEAGLYYIGKVQNTAKTFYVHSNSSMIPLFGFPDTTTYNTSNVLTAAFPYAALPATYPAVFNTTYSANGNFLVLFRIKP